MIIISIIQIFTYLFIFLIFNLFYFWLHWVFIAARGLSLVAASGGFSSLWCADSRHAGFSSCGSRALEHRLSSCGTRA